MQPTPGVRLTLICPDVHIELRNWLADDKRCSDIKQAGIVSPIKKPLTISDQGLFHAFLAEQQFLAPLTCSGPDASFFDRDGDSNSTLPSGTAFDPLQTLASQTC